MYRESRDFLNMELTFINIRSSLYGNPMFDADKGSKKLFESAKTAYNNIFYMNEKLKANTNKAKNTNNIDKNIALFKEIKKKLTGEAIREKCASFFNKHKKETHILGGEEAKRRLEEQDKLDKIKNK